MEPRSAPVAAPRAPAPAPRPRPRKIRLRATLAEPVPDEPIAVVLAGPGGGRHGEVLGALLGVSGPVLDVPSDSYLVVDHGQESIAAAFVPGSRQPQPHPPARSAGDAAPGRPPRRVEMTLPDPLLRHFALVGAPDADRLGAAGTSVLLDVARRGGAVVYVLTAGRPVAPAQLEVLARLADAGTKLFLVLTPQAAGTWSTGPDGLVDPVAFALDERRAALAAEVPGLAAAPWFAVNPAIDDTTYLRRALVEWAGVEGLRRASGNPPVPPGAGRTVRVAAEAHESGWADELDRRSRAAVQLLHQRLAADLAGLHLRCVQEIVHGGGPTALPEAFDRELHALSLRAAADGEAAATALVDDILDSVLAEPVSEGVRRRVADAVRLGFDDEPGDEDLARVLLVTSTGGVASVPGPAAVAALWAYRPVSAPALLPPIGVGLSGGCYVHWHNRANADPDGARSWLRRAVHEVELELLRGISRRFEALQRSFGTVVGEAVDHGILLR